MTEKRTNQTAERGAYVPLYDLIADGEVTNGWLSYAPHIDPVNVRLDVEGCDWSLRIPRWVLLEGLDGAAECQALMACPESSVSQEYALWEIRQGELAGRVFRVPQKVVAGYCNRLDELVPAGEEINRVVTATDWDAVCAAILGEPGANGE